MVDEKGHFLQVATRSTRKAWRINRIKPAGTAGRNPQTRFAVRAGDSRVEQAEEPRPGVRWLATCLRRIAAHWLRPLGHRPGTSANVFHTGAGPGRALLFLSSGPESLIDRVAER
jgi:hypothetical protein